MNTIVSQRERERDNLKRERKIIVKECEQKERERELIIKVYLQTRKCYPVTKYDFYVFSS